MVLLADKTRKALEFVVYLKLAQASLSCCCPPVLLPVGSCRLVRPNG